MRNLTIVAVFLFISCASDNNDATPNRSGNFCGNNQLNITGGEECDGEQLGGFTCESLGFLGAPDGALSCAENCRFDTSKCGKTCTEPAKFCTGRCTQTLDETECIDLFSNNRHCGALNEDCLAGDICIRGECIDVNLP